MEDHKRVLKEVEESLLLNNDLQVTEHLSSKNSDEIFLKVIPRTLDMEFQNSVYVIVSAKEKSISIRMFSYDHCRLGPNFCSKFSSLKISSVVINIEERLLNQQYFLCRGIKESESLDLMLPLDSILIQQFQGSVVYRSRDCSRLSSNQDELCSNCHNLFQNNKSTEDHLQNDFISNQKDYVESLKRDLSEDEIKTEIDNDIEIENVLASKSKKRKKINSNKIDKKRVGNTAQENLENVSCPIQNCPYKFKIFLAQAMRSHLLKKHCIDADNPPDEIKQALQPKPNADASGTVARDPATGRRIYACQHPGCSFVAKAITYLRYHAPVHTGEKMFCCQECGKTFKYKSDYIKCNKKHKGEFNFKCCDCDKGFLTKQKLEHHSKTHTGEKPFQCPFCIFRCSRPDNLNKHTKNTHGMSIKEAGKMALETGSVNVTSQTSSVNVTSHTSSVNFTSQTSSVNVTSCQENTENNAKDSLVNKTTHKDLKDSHSLVNSDLKTTVDSVKDTS